MDFTVQDVAVTIMFLVAVASFGVLIYLGKKHTRGADRRDQDPRP